jgi:putative two-component system response regulator
MVTIEVSVLTIGRLAAVCFDAAEARSAHPDERREIQRHVEAGAAILDGSTSDVLQVAREIVLSHHEWWDGNGYPARLRGEAIPVSGRVVALADVFDALTHERPYKTAWSVEDAVDEIHRQAGRQFDPDGVGVFSRLDAKMLVMLR